MKRLFDICFSLLGLIICFPLFVIVAVLIKLDSKGPVFFRQERIGKNFKSFKIYKFRTMQHDSEKKGPKITVKDDNRITKIGRILRFYKIDELPQLLNVFKGDMSFVGPRPEVREYVQLFDKDYEKLLSIRPGITDPASLYYVNESAILARSHNWEDDYRKIVLPEKIKLSLQYVDNHTFFTDLKLILRTVLKTVQPTR